MKKSSFKNIKRFPWLKTLEVVGIIAGILGLIYSILRTEESLVLSRESLRLAKDANVQSELSSRHTDSIATKTISLLDSISKSSSYLGDNLENFSKTLIPLNKSLLDLTTNLVNINQLSNVQLKELTKIIERLTSVNERLLIINQELDSTNKSLFSRRPYLVSYLECNPAAPYKIFLENIGSLRAKMDFECNFRGNSWQEYGMILNAGERRQLQEFTNREFVQGDSTALILKIYYFTESGDQSYYLNLESIKCK